MSNWDAMRASTADRERTVDILKAALAEGRLTSGEYDRRLTAALNARTYGELGQLVADLPTGPTPFSSPRPARTPPPVPALTTPWPSPAPVLPTRKFNDLAKASVISAALGVFSCGVGGIPAVITGHMALRQINRTNEAGSGAALTGLILGYLQVGFILLAVFGAIG